MSKIFYPGRKAVILIKIAVLSTFTSYAQNKPENLTLDEAISISLNNNKSLIQSGLDERIADAHYKEMGAIFLPQAGISYTAMATNDPLNAFGFKLQQRSVAQPDFNPDLLNHPGAEANFSTKLELKQPLLNLDMLYQRKGAEKQIELTGYKTQRTKEALIFEVQKAWLQLQLAYDAAAVMEEALLTARSVSLYTENRFKQGLIQKSDLLNAGVRVAALNNGLAKANSSISNASDYLSLLMGSTPAVVYKITAPPAPQPQNAIPVRKLDPSRADFMALEKAIDASDMLIKSGTMSYLPKLNAFGNYQLNDKRPAGFKADSYFVGVQLSWELFNGNRTKNNLAARKLDRDKLSEQLLQQKDQAQMELNKAYRDLSDAQTEIAQDREAVNQAAESFRILQNRYQQGLAATADVLVAETQLSQQKFELAKAVYNFNLASYFIQFLTSNTTK